MLEYIKWCYGDAYNLVSLGDRPVTLVELVYKRDFDNTYWKTSFIAEDDSGWSDEFKDFVQVYPQQVTKTVYETKETE